MSDLKSVTEASFEADVTLNGRPVLIDFWAEWCGPCKALAPTLEKVARNFEGKVDVVKINVDEHPAFRERFGVRGIPALVLMNGSQEMGRIVGPRSATQLASYLDAHLGIATQLAKPDATLSAFGGDAQMKAARIARLRDYLARMQATPEVPMWPENVNGALAFVVGSSEPDECAFVLGMPTDVLGTVTMLSTYRDTRLNAAGFVADWLESVPVGANLSALPGRLLHAILTSPIVSDTLGGDAALLAIRDELAALHAAEADGARGADARWAAVAQAAGEAVAQPAEGNRARAAAVLAAAASSLARNPDMLKEFVGAVCQFVQVCLKAKCHWGAEDESRLFKLMEGIFKHALDTGAEPPTGPAMMKHVAEIDARLVERFLSHYEEGQRASGERGGAIGDMLISLTRQFA
ncbi:thioredoxin [Burkholderia plantarii]|uniref:thioredoxin n=1 Tax=Burkholderia plantarii TaxID=41899 RepID=UPI0018DE328B|nr:thioredoxin [Burkholderia plantarii]MBI0330420.1 thioredoxin [Burkholderia plantarii]